MATYWLDYSAAKLSGSVIQQAGYAGAIRYIDSPANLGAKHTNKVEYASIVTANLGIRLVMQTTTTASDGGYPTGVDHAKRALAGANFLGYNGVIYFTNDRVTLPNPTSWDAYLTGAASVLGWGRTGAYGFANAMDVARDRTGCQHFWQAGRRSDVRSFVQFWQDNNTQVTVGGITCDRNLVLKELDDVPTTQEIVDGVLDAELDMRYREPGETTNKKATVRAVLEWTDRHRMDMEAKISALATQVAGVTGALSTSQAVILAAIGADSTDQVDVVALAEALSESLGPDIARGVANELHSRLAE